VLQLYTMQQAEQQQRQQHPVCRVQQQQQVRRGSVAGLSSLLARSAGCLAMQAVLRALGYVCANACTPNRPAVAAAYVQMVQQ
jgi:hypothetical protein